MKDSNFMVNFIQHCITQGQNTPERMCKIASERIKAIDQELKRAADLRNERTKLQKVITELSKGEETSSDNQVDTSIPEEKLGEYQRSLCVKICNFVEQKGSTTPSEIMESVGSYEEQKQVYLSIKWLSIRDIISRNDDKKLVKGSSWAQKPQ